MRYSPLNILFAAALLSASPAAFGTEFAQYGGATTWTNGWMAIGGLSDPVETGLGGPLDLAGDGANPVGYWGADATAAYFRLRINQPTVTGALTSDSYLVMIDRVGFGNIGPDFAFIFDGKSNDPTRHGLEMCRISVQGPTWGGTNFDDVDGSSSQKGTADINGGGRTGEGFVRTIDGQSGGTAGTTFMDFKVTWDYLSTYSTTGLARWQDWRISFATIANATDHNNINADVIGNMADDPALASNWSPVIAVPEPSTWGAGAFAVAALLARRRMRR